MPGMRGLTVIVAGADRDRFDAALTLVSAQAALGGRARLYCHGPAVKLLADAALLVTALDLGVEIIACQTALADHGVRLPTGAEAGGMVSLLQTLGDDRLVMA
ncbi:peroxiredoxin [Sphingomonas sp. RS2018]